MTIRKHLATVVIAAVAGALAGAGAQRMAGERSPVVEKVARLSVSKHAWPDLTQNETIEIGERLTSVIKGASVSILCNDSTCDDLAHDLDDAMQIADVGSTLDKPTMPLGRGFVIYASPGDDRAVRVAEVIKAATGGKLEPQSKTATLADGEIAIAIGPRVR